MSDTARPAETVSESVPTRHATPDLAELRDQIAGTIHRRICEHSREDCIENLGNCERATDSAMPLISTALDDGIVLARLLSGALNDAQAWDEGARTASQCASPTGRCARNGWDCDHPNPYRQEADHG